MPGTAGCYSPFSFLSLFSSLQNRIQNTCPQFPEPSFISFSRPFRSFCLPGSCRSRNQGNSPGVPDPGPYFFRSHASVLRNRLCSPAGFSGLHRFHHSREAGGCRPVHHFHAHSRGSAGSVLLLFCPPDGSAVFSCLRNTLPRKDLPSVPPSSLPADPGSASWKARSWPCQLPR